MKTVEVKNERGESFDLPYIHMVPRRIFKTLSNIRDLQIQINEATIAKTKLSEDDENFQKKTEFQNKRLRTAYENYEKLVDILDEDLADTYDGWTEFSKNLSQRAFAIVIGKVLGTTYAPVEEIYQDGALDFLQPQ